ncbi:MAG: ABC transporter ATP-binding protein, partial [Spirochaetaceae bacterium]
ERARGMLCMVGLTDVDDRMPDELSGGQQQRVALARALSAQPQLLLMDEPFSNLDASLRDATRREIRSLLKAQGLNAILVTHDQEEALSFCDRLAVMNEGRIEQVGTPEEVYHHPRTAFVAQFLGRANLLSGTALGEFAETELGTIPIRPATTGEVLLSLRPEHLQLAALPTPAAAMGAAPLAEPPNRGEVVAREFRGHDVTYRVQCNGRGYLAHTEYTHSFFPGQAVTLAPREPAVVLRTVASRAHNLTGEHR